MKTRYGLLQNAAMILSLSLVATAPGSAWAQAGVGGAGALGMGGNAGDSSAPPAPPTDEPGLEGCTPTWPSDLAPPQLEQDFPKRGTAGHVSLLVLTIEHRPGEQVLPGGLELPQDAPERAALEEASFFLPDATSDTQPSLATAVANSVATTTLRLPLIPLPAEAGRTTLTLPALPIAIARASGQIQKICTRPQRILVEDPLASANDPAPRPDPPPRPQREIWWLARNVVLGLLTALPLALLAFWLVSRFAHKLKKTPPPPPPVPAWQTALASLQALESEGLLDRSQFEEHLDAVVDVLRRYLGERYGFDGLESTTRELLKELDLRSPNFPEGDTVRSLLQRSDLVKFARQLPTAEECLTAFSAVETLVKRTMPRATLDPRSSTSIDPEAPRASQLHSSTRGDS